MAGERDKVRLPKVLNRLEGDYMDATIVNAVTNLHLDGNLSQEEQDLQRKKYMCFLIAQRNYDTYRQTLEGVSRKNHLKRLTAAAQAGQSSTSHSSSSVIAPLSGAHGVSEHTSATVIGPVDDKTKGAQKKGKTT